MSGLPLASVVISSYNYGRFLPDAIDSALGQTYPHTEVIVVDDGSTDHSREVIAGYGRRVVPLLKENGGQASAFNAGLRASRGDVVFFLDSDDALLPTAVARAVEFFRDPGVAKVHWPLREIDVRGRETGTVWPLPCSGELAEGNLRDQLIRGGPLAYVWPPTTGNAWARRFLERVFPMPEADFRTCPDLYLSALAPLFGSIRRVREPQSCWRYHGQNRTWSDPVEERLRVLLGRTDSCCDAVARWCRRMGLDVDVEARRADWKSQPWLQWLHQTQHIKEEIAALVPAGDTLLLVEGQDPWWPDDIVAGRRAIPFMEKEGEYWGSPEDDATGIREVERLRQAGANFMVFGWQSFWWLDYYAGLHRHLRARFRCLVDNERLVVFDLRPEGYSPALSVEPSGRPEDAGLPAPCSGRAGGPCRRDPD
jgi:glycosyltransferase involved in cell wall biosynthesis